MRGSIINYRSEDLSPLQAKLNFTFSDLDKLVIALSHPSVNSLRAKNQAKFEDYERFEFLGDSILNFIITEILFGKFDSEQEGKLSKIRTTLVCKDSLVEIAGSLDLASFLYLSPGEEKTGGRANPNNLENAMEAVIAAIYLDAGIDKTREIVEFLWHDKLLNIDMDCSDPKSFVQEWSQKHGKLQPSYRVVEESGSAHNPSFKATIVISGEPEVSGTGSNKKLAQKRAAYNFMQSLKTSGRI
jgi:ribonuclease III